MVESKNTNQIIFSKIADGLDYTSKLVHALLENIKDSEADFAAVKTEIANIRENVKALSSIIRDGSSAAPLITQVALIQEKLESLDKWIESHSEKHKAISISYDGTIERIKEIEMRLSNIEEFISNTFNQEKILRQSLVEIENHGKYKTITTYSIFILVIVLLFIFVK